MKFNLKFTEEAKAQFLELENSTDKVAQYKSVAKTLGLMQLNLRHPSLHTYKYDAITSPFGVEFSSLMLKIIRQEFIAFFGVMDLGVV